MSQDLKELYGVVSQYVNEVRCNELWRGFQPLRFALYNDNECFFDGEYIEKTEAFLANTSIEYNGEYIAIWNVTGEMDPKILASKMIHEMFHGFQNKNKESRFPQELNALQCYHYSDENLSIKLRENQLIAELTEKFSKEKLDLLLQYRRYRYNHFQYEYLYEAKVEQIEGTANYVELNALKQISEELYSDKLEQMKKSITNPANLLPIRIVSYDIGALLLHIIKENGIAVDEGFSDTTFSESLIGTIEEKKPYECTGMSQYMDTYFGKAQRVIDKAIQNNEIVMEGESSLLAVNVYNAVCLNGYITSTYFVMYGEEENPTTLYGNFVIESPKEGVVIRIYKME